MRSNRRRLQAYSSKAFSLFDAPILEPLEDRHLAMGEITSERITLPSRRTDSDFDVRTFPSLNASYILIQFQKLHDRMRGILSNRPFRHPIQEKQPLACRAVLIGALRAGTQEQGARQPDGDGGMKSHVIAL
jgi:hypothetical protein